MISRTIEELAELCGATVDGDATRSVEGPATLSEASQNEISFLGNPKYRALLNQTRACAVVVGEDEERHREDLTFLRCANPSRAFSEVVQAFRENRAAPQPGVHPTATLAEDVQLGAEVSIGPYCVVAAGTTLAERVVLHAGVTIGAGVSVGAGSILYANATIYDGVTVGADCIFHSGVVIGSDGFGFEPSEQGWVKIPQCGSVTIGDHVEIGANSCVDCGRFSDTVIGNGVKIDNLVHIAHNCQIGDHSLLAAQVGIAGSCVLGKQVVMGGQAGISGHATLGDAVRVAGRSAIFGDLEGGADYLGHPALPRKRALRILAAQKRLPEVLNQIRELQERLELLERDRAGSAGMEEEGL